MYYIKKKNFLQKSHINNVLHNSGLYIVLQIKYHNLMQWVSLKKELIPFKVNIKLFKAKALKKQNIYNNFANYFPYAYQKNVYTGKIFIIYPIESCEVDLKNLQFFINKYTSFTCLYAFFNNRVLSIPKFNNLAYQSNSCCKQRLFLFFTILYKP